MLRSLAALLVVTPFAVSAQPVPGDRRAASFTREQFVQRAADMAGRRFDAIDTTHAGVVTRDQIRAYRQAHGRMAGQRLQ